MLSLTHFLLGSFGGRDKKNVDLGVGFFFFFFFFLGGGGGGADRVVAFSSSSLCLSEADVKSPPVNGDELYFDS